jgi:hypothetical protein
MVPNSLGDLEKLVADDQNVELTYMYSTYEMHCYLQNAA